MENRTAAFIGDVSQFYEGVAYGLVVLVIPVLVWTLGLSSVLAWLAMRFKARVGPGLAFIFILAFALIGGVAGAIAGATLESIVGAALAAILGLVTSMLAYLFGKETLRVWRPVIPLALIALLTSTLVGLVIGGSRRTQSLSERARVEADKYRLENVAGPAQREIAILLARKCVEGKSYDEAVDRCQ